ncbi:hypothetical protein GE09DRAFT_781996 [Coniochaeta sp. 2T2.1]|nr:hypothetical protein GE09DRAFT_781996 [Coniochaeta sp. 2T2.1]
MATLTPPLGDCFSRCSVGSGHHEIDAHQKHPTVNDVIDHPSRDAVGNVCLSSNTPRRRRPLPMVKVRRCPGICRKTTGTSDSLPSSAIVSGFHLSEGFYPHDLRCCVHRISIDGMEPFASSIFSSWYMGAMRAPIDGRDESARCDAPRWASLVGMGSRLAVPTMGGTKRLLRFLLDRMLSGWIVAHLKASHDVPLSTCASSSRHERQSRAFESIRTPLNRGESCRSFQQALLARVER